MLGALTALAKFLAQGFQLLFVERAVKAVEHVLRACPLRFIHQGIATLEHIREHPYLRPKVVVAKPHHEVANRAAIRLIVQNPQSGGLLPCAEYRAMRKFKQHVVISKVCQTRHLLSQLVGNLVQRLHHESPLAVIQSQQVLVQFLKETFVILTLTRNPALALATPLVGKGNTSEESVRHVPLIEQTGSLWRRAECKVYAEQGIAGHSFGSSTQSACTLAVVDVAHHLAHLLVSATHLVGHLHLGQVQILRAASLLLKCQGVLQESGRCDIGRREPEANCRTLRFLLVCSTRLHLTNPVGQLPIFHLVVVSEWSHDGLDEMCQLRLTDTAWAYQMPHLATKFIILVIGIHQFHVGQMSSKCRQSHRN